MAEDSTTRELINVRFSEPVEGIDPDDGEVLVATRHRVRATWIRVDNKETLFLDDGSEVLASWPTESIEHLAWAPDLSIDISQWLARNWRAERLERLRESYPHAYERWTEEEDEQLRTEFDDGLTLDEMVERHGRAGGGILARLVRMELIERDTPASAIGHPEVPRQ